MDFKAWTLRHPQAAAELVGILTDNVTLDVPKKAVHGSESWAQQNVRFMIASQGGFAFRNNVGATPRRCPKCKADQRVVRYGLANDSAQMNKRIKSSDLILAIPRLITPDMVGTKIAQFGSVECKKPDWKYTGTGREPGQAAWLSFVESLGGYGKFSTGNVDLGLN